MNHYELIINGGNTYSRDVWAESYEVSEIGDTLGTQIMFLNIEDEITCECHIAPGHSFVVNMMPKRPNL